MAFCPGCGTQVADGVTFCPSCGKPISAGAGTAAAPAPAPAVAASSGLADNIAGLLCYCPAWIGLIASIVFLVAEPYKSNKFIRFHAFQSLFLHAALIVIGIAWWILSAIVTMVAGPLGMLMFPLFFLIGLACLGLMIFMMIKAYGMQTLHLPVIGGLADKQV